MTCRAIRSIAALRYAVILSLSVMLAAVARADGGDKLDLPVPEIGVRQSYADRYCPVHVQIDGGTVSDRKTAVLNLVRSTYEDSVRGVVQYHLAGIDYASFSFFYFGVRDECSNVAVVSRVFPNAFADARPAIRAPI
jgi:hypothetical protein